MKKKNPTTPVRTPEQAREYGLAKKFNAGKAERREAIGKALEEIGYRHGRHHNGKA